MVDYVVYGRGSFEQLDEILIPRRKGDSPMIFLVDHFFGKAVSSITNMLDPDIIVVGGGVGNIDEIYTEGVKSLKHFIFNNYCTVPVIRPQLGDSAGVFGAAALTQGYR